MPNFLWTSRFYICIIYFIFIFLRKTFHVNCTIKQRTVNPLMRNKNSVIYPHHVLNKGHGCRRKGSTEMYVSFLYICDYTVTWHVHLLLML